MGIEDLKERDSYFCEYLLPLYFVIVEGRLTTAGRRVVASRANLPPYESRVMEHLARYLFFTLGGNISQIADSLGIQFTSLFEMLKHYGISATTVNDLTMPTGLPRLYVANIGKPGALDRRKLERVADDMLDTAMICHDYIRNDIPNMTNNERMRAMELCTKVGGELQMMISSRLKDAKGVKENKRVEALIGMLVTKYGWKPEEIIRAQTDAAMPNGKQVANGPYRPGWTNVA